MPLHRKESLPAVEISVVSKKGKIKIFTSYKFVSKKITVRLQLAVSVAVLVYMNETVITKSEHAFNLILLEHMSRTA